MSRRKNVTVLIDIMGSKTWDIVSLTEAFNKISKWGLSTMEIAQKMRFNKEFQVVGVTSVSVASINTQKKGYKLYAVKPQYLEVNQ